MPDTLISNISLIEAQPVSAKMARCEGELCDRLLPSSLPLLRFRAKPNESTDQFYCGCGDTGG